MTSNIERILLHSSDADWETMKLEGKVAKTIRIGSNLLYNGVMLNDYICKNEIIRFLQKYEISTYVIEPILNKNATSYRLYLSENKYNKLLRRLKRTASSFVCIRHNSLL